MRAQNLLMIVFLVALTGCTSIRSLPLNRSPDDEFTKNQPIPFKGIPITMKVPTHLDVEIIETYYLQNVACFEKVTGKPDAQTYADLREIPMTHRNLSVKVTPIFTEKVFTVDFKRPASGSLEYGATFGTDQYFDSIKGTVIDRTIEDVTALVKAAAPLAGFPTSANFGDELTNVIVNTRTVAFRRFDIDECYFEQSVQDFAMLHLNACNNCYGEVTPKDLPDSPAGCPTVPTNTSR